MSATPAISLPARLPHQGTTGVSNDEAIIEPLTGHTARYGERTPAGDIALRHLSFLGARLERAPSGPERAETSSYSLRPPSTDQDELTAYLGWSCSAAASLTDETSVQAVTGMMAVHGRRRGVPTRLPLDYASACAGVLSVHGVLASLIARERGATVSRTGTSVMHAGLLAVSQYLAAATGDEEEKLPTDTPEAGPPFCSRDGVFFELEALDPRPWQEFWSELEAPAADIRRSWQPFVLRYPRAVCPLAPSLSAAVRAVDFADISALAQRTGMSVCAVRTLAQRRRDVDALADGVSQPPWTFLPGASDPAPFPTAITPPPPSLPLSGVTVLEAGRRIQAPLAAHVLQLLGARVIRIEPVDGDPLRGMPPMAGDCSARFLALNKGKEVVHADLKSPAGRETVLEVARGADAFLHNWAPGKAARFGLDFEDLQAVNPRLVYAYSSGWGQALGDDAPLGTDFMAQAHSGLADMMATDGVPRPSLMTLIDVLGGLVAAEGILAGLLHRERTGRATRVDTSLLSASTTLQYPALENGPARTPRGCGAPRLPALEGPWPTSEGWLAVSVHSLTAVRRLCRLLNLNPDQEEQALREGFAARFAHRPAEEWVNALSAEGVTANTVTTDLRQLENTPLTSTALTHEECTFVTAPWRFDA